MGALRDFAEITIENEPPAGASVVEKAMFAEMQTVGQRLSTVRRAKGLTLLDVANGVKIKIDHLVAIEGGNRGALPAVPFTAGFVKAYAQFLGLDPEEYASAYRREAGGSPAPQTEAAAPSVAAAPQWETSASALAAPKREFSLPAGQGALASYFGIGAALFCAAWFGVSMLPRTAPEAPARGAEPETVAEAQSAPAIVAEAPTVPPVEAAPAMAEPVIDETVIAAAESAAEAAPADVKTAPAPSRKAAPKRPAEVALAPETDAAPIVASETPAINDTATTGAGESVSVDSVYWEIPQAAPAPSTEGIASAPPAAGPETAPVVIADIAPAAVIAAASAPPLVMAAATPEPKIVPAQIIRAAEPVYPERCVRGAAPTESVDVIFSITAQGRPAGAAVVQSSNDCFNGAAMNAASDMRFGPRTVDGKPAIETAKVVTIRFAR